MVADGNSTYLRLIPEEKHTRGNHGKELAERVWTTTQTVENAFSLFKRAIVGNYHKLSPWHLDRYMREFCWRYNRRRMQASIFEMALTSMVSRTPLPYKTLVLNYNSQPPGHSLAFLVFRRDFYEIPGLKSNVTLAGITALAAASDGSVWAGIMNFGPGLGLQQLVNGTWRTSLILVKSRNLSLVLTRFLPSG